MGSLLLLPNSAVQRLKRLVVGVFSNDPITVLRNKEILWCSLSIVVIEIHLIAECLGR